MSQELLAIIELITQKVNQANRQKWQINQTTTSNDSLVITINKHNFFIDIIGGIIRINCYSTIVASLSTEIRKFTVSLADPESAKTIAEFIDECCSKRNFQ